MIIKAPWAKSTFVLLRQKNQLVSEMAQKGLNEPEMVPYDQHQLVGPFGSILDSFRLLWTMDKPAMFGHYWSKMYHF